MQRYSAGRMKTTPPRLIGLLFRRRTFSELMAPIIWNYVIDMIGLDEPKEVEDDDDDISSDDDESSSGVLTPPAAEVAVAIHSSTGATTVDDSSTSKYPHLS